MWENEWAHHWSNLMVYITKGNMYGKGVGDSAHLVMNSESSNAV